MVCSFHDEAMNVLTRRENKKKEKIEKVRKSIHYIIDDRHNFFYKHFPSRSSGMDIEQQPRPPCAGFVVLDMDSREPRVVIVKTHAGHAGFPKGKREGTEGVLEGALRELGEESGLGAHQITIVPGVFRDEMVQTVCLLCNYSTIINNIITFSLQSAKGNPATRYQVALVSSTTPLRAYDEDELASVEWMAVGDAARMLREGRRHILNWAITQARSRM